MRGALEFRECVGDDVNVKMGMPFPRMARLERNGTAVFLWIVFKSRAHRDRVISKKARGTSFEVFPRSSDLEPVRSPRDGQRSHSPEGTRFAQFGDGREEFACIGATARGVIGFKPFFEHIKREKPDQVRKRDDALFRGSIEPGPVSDVLFRPEEVHGASGIGKALKPS